MILLYFYAFPIMQRVDRMSLEGYIVLAIVWFPIFISVTTGCEIDDIKIHITIDELPVVFVFVVLRLRQIDTGLKIQKPGKQLTSDNN